MNPNNRMCRRFVVADIHGCAATFTELLAQLDVQRCDTLYLRGDYIDRGPHSKGVLDQILALLADGYALCPLRGNHEQLLLDALDNPKVFRHNVCQLKKKDSPLANVGYAAGINPTAQSHNQGGES